MAQTFKVSKERSHPATRKHRGKLVVSAISKTPITVTPVTPTAVASPPAPVALGIQPGRPRGRPRKAPPSQATPAAVKKAAKLKRGRPHRIDHKRLLDADNQRGHTRPAGKVPLAASRIVEQLISLLGRATVEAFRGKRDRPALTLSKLEEQAIQEALTLFKLKVSLQRGGEVRRVRVS